MGIGFNTKVFTCLKMMKTIRINCNNCLSIGVCEEYQVHFNLSKHTKVGNC